MKDYDITQQEKWSLTVKKRAKLVGALLRLDDEKTPFLKPGRSLNWVLYVVKQLNMTKKFLRENELNINFGTGRND